MSEVALLVLLALAIVAEGAAVPDGCSDPYRGVTKEGLCTQRLAGGFAKPRGMAVEAVDGKTRIMLVDAGLGSIPSRIYLLIDENGDGSTAGAGERKVLVTTGTEAETRLTHGIAIVGDFVFATSAQYLYRWRYDRAGRSLSDETVVVEGLSYYVGEDGNTAKTFWGHVTRTIAVHGETMYISTGSVGNVDTTPYRSMIRKVALSTVTAEKITGRLDFTTLAVVASGLRNEVGLAFDKDGVLWGVENGADRAYRSDMGDVHTDNPPEELNRIDVREAAKFYGYPYCFTELSLPEAGKTKYGHQPGRQWVWESEHNPSSNPPLYGPNFTTSYTDAWCNNETNNVRPYHLFGAHTAPLGITFLGDECGKSPGAFPCKWKGRAFVAFHGSWNRDIPVGYKVSMLDLESHQEEDILVSSTLNEGKAKWPLETRPVDVQFDPITGVLIVTQDGRHNGATDWGDVLLIRTGSSPPTPSKDRDSPSSVLSVGWVTVAALLVLCTW